MKIILCTGDSHTWGEGASGLREFCESIKPYGMPGTLRAMPFKFPSYVNLLREYINKKTNSYANEYYGEKLNAFSLAGDCKTDDFINIKSGDACLKTKCKAIRLEFICGLQESIAEISIDGKFLKEVRLKAIDGIPYDDNNNGSAPKITKDIYFDSEGNWYKFVFIDMPYEGEHELKIKALNGTVRIFRAESYGGEYAVINAGIGGCTTRRMLNVFFEDFISIYKPEIIIAEAQSINDWLTITLDESYEYLLKLLKKFKDFSQKTYLMTVSPVLEEQKNATNVDYSKYIESSKKAAKDCGVSVIDANKVMLDILKEIPEDAKASLMFSDKWHLNDYGNKIYFECIAETIQKDKII